MHPSVAMRTWSCSEALASAVLPGQGDGLLGGTCLWLRMHTLLDVKRKSVCQNHDLGNPGSGSLGGTGCGLQRRYRMTTAEAVSDKSATRPKHNSGQAYHWVIFF